MANPHIWPIADIIADAAVSTDRFRQERFGEPLAMYEELFAEYAGLFNDLIDSFHVILAEDLDQEAFAALLDTKEKLNAFRYIAAPPISDGDLCTLAETTLSRKRMRTDAEAADRVREVIRQAIDPLRFPWIAAGRAPSPEERRRAITASAAMIASRRLETLRRGEAGNAQEVAVMDAVRAAGFVQVERRPIELLDQAPAPGHFCGESQLGPTRADVVVRLRDRRVLAIECKVSNTKVNSFKRLNHEALGKATKWMEAYGNRQVVPAAVLRGCFKPENVRDAQASGLYIYWEHRLEDLAAFLAAAV